MVIIREAEIVINPIDNVTQALDKINSFLSKLSDGAIIDIRINDVAFDKLDEVQKRVSEIGGTIPLDVSIADNSEAVARNISANANNAAQSLGTVSNAGKNIGKELEISEKKGAGFFSSLKSGAISASESISGLSKGISAIAGLAVTGSIAGYSWMGAKESKEYQEEIIKSIEVRRGPIKGPAESEEARKFIKAAGELGYTTGTRRAETLQYAALNTKNIPMEKIMKATGGAEKLVFSSEIAKRQGYGAADIMALATRSSLSGLRPAQKAQIDAIFAQYGIKDFTKMGQKQRMTVLAELDTKIDIEAEMKAQPEEVLKIKLDKMSKSIGSAMIGPMLNITNAANTLIDVFESFPVLSGIVGYGLIFTTAATALGLLFSVLSSTKSGLSGLYNAFGKVAEKIVKFTSATVAHTAAEVASAASTEANTAATTTNTASKNLGIVARVRHAAATVASTIAEKAHTAATIIGNAVSWARVAATAALSGALFVGAAAASASTVATGGLAAAEAIASAGAYALAAGVWAALSPLLPFIAAGAVLAGVLALVANKAGILEPILKGLGSINLSRVWKDIKKGDFDRAWRDLTKGFKLPSLEEMWKNLTTVKLPDMSKLLSSKSITAGISAVFSLFGKTGEDLLASILKYIKSITDFADWILDKIKSIENWIKDVLGITKEEKKQKVERIAESEGVTWDKEKNAWVNKITGEIAIPSARLAKAQAEYENAPGGIVSDLLSGIKDFFDRLPGLIASAIKGIIPGAGGTEGNRSAAEYAAGAAVEAEHPGVYAQGPNEGKIPPSEWPLNYAVNPNFGEQAVYGPNGEPTGEKISDIFSPEAAKNALVQAAIAGGKPESTPEVHVSYDTYLDMFKAHAASSPVSSAALEEIRSGKQGVEVKTDKFGNEYVATIAPPTPQQAGSLYPSYGGIDADGNSTFNVMRGSEIVASGFKSDAEARAYIASHSMAVGGQILSAGFLIGHGGEEVSPASVVLGGKTTLAKINDAVLRDLSKEAPTASSRSGTTINMGGFKVDVNNPVLPDTGAVYHLTSVLKRELEPFIEETIKRRTTQYIT